MCFFRRVDGGGVAYFLLLMGDGVPFLMTGSSAPVIRYSWVVGSLTIKLMGGGGQCILTVVELSKNASRPPSPG